MPSLSLIRHSIVSVPVPSLPHTQTMPIGLQPASSAASSLRSEPLLSPPLSHNGSEDVPFKADDGDRISLSMKKSKGHRHGHPRPFAHPTVGSTKDFSMTVSRDSLKVCNSVGQSLSPPTRRAHSQPSIPSQFVSKPVEVPSGSEARARRWTVSSKAAPSRALATVVPVQKVANKRSTNKGLSSTSPAMITLRRATGTSPQPRLSLTSFPTPKFGRRNSGLLSAIFDTITTGHHYTTAASDINRRASTHKPASISNSSSEVRPGTSSIAPPVRTEVPTREPRFSFSGRASTVQPVRRCSTRYISDDGVYEIIWDQNSSTAISEGAAPSPQSTEWTLGRRESGQTETLERRLSQVLSQSRRTSVQEVASRRGSYWPGSETMYTQGLLDLFESPKLARLAQQTAFRTLPRSKASKMTLNPAVAYFDVTQEAVVEPAGERAKDEVLQFFPPLRSRSNTAESTKLHDTFPTWGESERQVYKHLDTAISGRSSAKGGWSRRKSSYGRMIGISNHAKRRSISAGPHVYKTRAEGDGDRDEGIPYRFLQGELSEDTVPLLGDTR